MSYERITETLVRGFVAGDVSLDRLWDWVLLGPDGQGEDSELSKKVALRICEHQNGDWTEDELRDLFRPFVGSFTITSGRPFVATGTFNRTIYVNGGNWGVA